MRITKNQAKIRDRHLKAKQEGSFDYPNGHKINSRDELIKILNSGKTSQGFLEEIEIRYCNVTSIMLSNMSYNSQSYRSGINKGFSKILANLGII